MLVVTGMMLWVLMVLQQQWVPLQTLVYVPLASVHQILDGQDKPISLNKCSTGSPRLLDHLNVELTIACLPLSLQCVVCTNNLMRIELIHLHTSILRTDSLSTD